MTSVGHGTAKGVSDPGASIRPFACTQPSEGGSHEMIKAMWRLRCPDCAKEFMVAEEDLEDELVTWPNCCADVPVDEE